jgi:purine-binding chemotaxis protein CheW
MPQRTAMTEPPRFEDGRSSLLVFRVATATLAVNAQAVEAVHDHSTPSPVPRAPTHLLGLVRLGEHAVPLVDLGVFLGLGKAGPSEDHAEDALFRRIVVVRKDAMRVGLGCDRALGVMDVDGAEMLEPTALRGGRLGEFLEAEIHTAEGVVIGLLQLGALLEAARL